MKLPTHITLTGVEHEQAKYVQQGLKPEFFRLPKRGGDPFFYLTRAWYYTAEKRGLIRLVRLRDQGKLRGVTLVPYEEVARVIREAKAEQNPLHPGES